MSSVIPLIQDVPVLCSVDDYDTERFLPVAAAFGQRRYGYVVTPNADHLVRLHDDAQFRRMCADASYVLLDSRFVACWLRLTCGERLPVCAGSDLVARLFQSVIAPDDPLVLIGATAQQADSLRAKFGLRALAHHNPPMGFMGDAQAVEACLRFVESHSPFRYCFLAVGSPRQEYLAWRLRERAAAAGLALCVGASIDFLTGAERRAPLWIRQLCLEWAFRLLQNPARMAHRYLVRQPRMFGIVRHSRLALRAPSGSSEIGLRATPQLPH